MGLGAKSYQSQNSEEYMDGHTSLKVNWGCSQIHLYKTKECFKKILNTSWYQVPWYKDSLMIVQH